MLIEFLPGEKVKILHSQGSGCKGEQAEILSRIYATSKYSVKILTGPHKDFIGFTFSHPNLQKISSFKILYSTPQKKEK